MADENREPIILEEGQLCELDRLFAEREYEETDPRSIFYIRKLNRPHIRWGKIALALTLPIFGGVLLYLLCEGVFPDSHIGIAAVLVGGLLYLAVILKRGILCLIRIYQRYAPDRIRNKCRFEPSCSEYMLLAIEKYGLISGVKRGICRLMHCNHNGGGFDDP